MSVHSDAMLLPYSLIRPVLFALPPETAHGLALTALKWGVAGKGEAPPASLATRVFGLDFPSPLGLAAGFDKNAEAIAPLLALGFGFVEAGTVTPRPQPGNPRPRLFRLAENEALINRLGFNNRGLEFFTHRLRSRPPAGIVGANIGKNKDSANAIADYVEGFTCVAPLADYVTVNISSPNTAGLRDLQGEEELTSLLSSLQQTRADLQASGALSNPVPILVKIAPDLTSPQLEAVARVARQLGVDGLIVSNTTISRPPGLTGEYAAETGGLSGRPLFPASTATLRALYRLTEGAVPLIGVGGISSGADAYEKIRAGASLIQLYTGFIYRGPGLIARIHAELAGLLARDGFSSVAEAVGKG